MKLTKNDKVTIDLLLQEGLITSELDLIGDNKKASIMYNYMVKKFGYLLNSDLLSEEEIALRKKVNLFIKKIGPLFLQNTQVFENRNTLKNSNDTTPDKPITLPDNPVGCLTMVLRMIHWHLF